LEHPLFAIRIFHQLFNDVCDVAVQVVEFGS
jgi:hypothetical protein